MPQPVGNTRLFQVSPSARLSVALDSAVKELVNLQIENQKTHHIVTSLHQLLSYSNYNEPILGHLRQLVSSMLTCIDATKSARISLNTSIEKMDACINKLKDLPTNNDQKAITDKALALCEIFQKKLKHQPESNTLTPNPKK